MDFLKHGDLILREQPGPEGEAKLASLLLRIYRTYTPEQIRTLLSKPKPLVLVREIRETNATKLIEMLRAHGVSLQFVPKERGDLAGATGGDVMAGRTAAGAAPRHLGLRFTGSAGEYFRIWIVNIALTILTLGVYLAWAKVRTRRYFYANTFLDNQPFDYLAKPGTILKGHLIVGGALLLMNVSGRISPLIGSMLYAVGLSLVPYLIYKAHRFKARSSAYRNIRFRFTGGPWEAYKAHAFFPLAGVLGLLYFIFLFPNLTEARGGPNPGAPPGIGFLLWTVVPALGIMAAYPYFAFLQRRYTLRNFAFGKTESSFTGRPGRFFGIYASAFFIVFLAIFLGSLAIGMTSALVFKTLGLGKEAIKAGVIGLTIISYVFFGILFLTVRQYIFAAVFNYTWGKTRVEPVAFEASLKGTRLAFIRLTNLLAIVLSLGFLAPWAKVRLVRYLLPRTTVILPGDMEEFEAAAVHDEGAIGDTAADFFDWDIGW